MTSSNFNYNHEQQLRHWEQEHKKGAIHLSKDATKESFFAQKTLRYLNVTKNKYLLDLGCGAGNDAYFFAQEGFFVSALDFSKTIISGNKKRYTHENLKFFQMNILNFSSTKEKAWGTVYAKGSLHYFTDLQLNDIFKKIFENLSPNGIFAMLGKSIHDPIYGMGEEIIGEKDMFNIGGRYRKFLNKTKIDAELQKIGFIILDSANAERTLYGHRSNCLEIIAQKPSTP